ncbi:hypothetical protein RRG08_022661 [Elysia crispata]|uniref:Uncharacterized protein n=1 Tax=Elysia crispata TaxID=231223 RepID=A0AAE0Z3M5_9GAST|nr:hypothetical protein RRG08_022661 [Elysia crispata]
MEYGFGRREVLGWSERIVGGEQERLPSLAQWLTQFPGLPPVSHLRLNKVFDGSPPNKREAATSCRATRMVCRFEPLASRDDQPFRVENSSPIKEMLCEYSGPEVATHCDVHVKKKNNDHVPILRSLRVSSTPQQNGGGNDVQWIQREDCKYSWVYREVSGTGSLGDLTDLVTNLGHGTRRPNPCQKLTTNRLQSAVMMKNG